MKKNALIVVLAAGLLSVMTLVACTADGSGDTDTAGTTPDTTSVATDTALSTNTDTEAPTDESEAYTDPDTAVTEPESETESHTDATESDTESADTEAVTAAPRYDYLGAEVAPNVTIDASAYTDMQLTLPGYLQITDADVKEYIEYIRFDYRIADNGTARMTDSPMKLGDDAFIYYKGIVDGEEFEGGSNWDSSTPYQLGLGSGSFIPGFEAGLVGIIPQNATKENPAEIHLTFPEDYTNHLAGRNVTFYVAVEYAVQYSLPAYNRAFVEETLQYEGEKNFYASDKALLSEFEGYLRTYLEQEIAAEVENAKVDALWTHLTDSAICTELPQIEIDFYYNNYLSEIEYYYEYYTMYGGSEFTAQYPTLDAFACSYVGVDKDGDWKAEIKAYAETIVKKDMVSHAIAEREGMETVTEEEYQAELKSLVDYYQGYMSEADIIASMGEQTIRESAFATKIRAWLMERADFTFETSAE